MEVVSEAVVVGVVWIASAEKRLAMTEHQEVFIYICK